MAEINVTDTHCHIHMTGYKLDPDQVIRDGVKAGVTRALCVGTDLADSIRSINFTKNRHGLWSTIGLHPHDSKAYQTDSTALKTFASLVGEPKVVAIGECGLDYYYNHSPKEDQERLLRFQLEIASEHRVPVIFHVREAFEDFWKILDNYPNITGVVHSFSADRKELDRILNRGLYVGLNGIMTFTKNIEQLAAARAVPLDKLLLETDAPYLTPTPYRGTICQLMHVRTTAEFLARERGESLSLLAKSTTKNAMQLFKELRKDRIDA